MQFECIEINDPRSALGLPMQSLKRLGQLIFLVGPNGCGKTRLLKIIRKMASSDVERVNSTTQLAGELRAAQDRLAAMKSFHEMTARYSKGADDEAVQHAQKSVQAAQKAHDSIELQLKRIKEGYRIPPVTGQLPIYLPARTLGIAVPKKADAGVTTSNLERKVGDPSAVLKAVSFANTSRGPALDEFFGLLANTKFSTHNALANVDVLERWNKIYESVERLSQELIDRRFGFIPETISAAASLGNRRLSPEELSDGQRQVLGMIAGIVAANEDVKSLSGRVVLVDEPELHLHPSAAAQFVQAVIDAVGPTGQVWIATHSISLISRFDQAQIWTIKDGVAFPPGVDASARALEALVGDAEAASALARFVSAPAAAAAATLAAECLSAPATVACRTGDPQLLQVIEGAELMGGCRIRVIDIGAGQGRLAAALQQVVIDHPIEIEYVAVEPDVGLHDQIRRSAGPLLLGERIFHEVSELPVEFDQTFHAAVLCNVLHEVRPTQWCSLFEQIKARLVPNGRLVVCEDQHLPHGEGPNDIGLILLSDNELRTLFGTQDIELHPSKDERYAGRLTCAVVRNNALRVTRSSVRRAIENLRRRMETEVGTLRRKQDPTARDGRRYALVSQLLINSMLALEELPSDPVQASGPAGPQSLEVAPR